MSDKSFTIQRVDIREENPWQIDVYLHIFDENEVKVGRLELNLLDDDEILNWEDACNFFDGDDYPWVLQDLIRSLNREGFEWNGEKWEVR